MLVRDRMSVPPLTVRTDADYQVALTLMQQHAVHHVPVLDDAGALAGILAERDLLLAATRYLRTGVDVADIMHRDVVTVTPRTGLARAAALLVRHKIGGLPVVERGGRVVGVITETDLLGAFVELLAGEVATRATPPALRRRRAAARARRPKIRER